MEWVALITWILTAGGGFVLLSIWLSRGGVRRQREAGLRIRPPLIFSHFGLAAAGLVLWIIYVATDSEGLAWIAFAVLAVVAVLGWTMFAIWWQRRQGRTTAGANVATAPEQAGEPPEQQFPVPVVTLHGLLAVATVVLVFLTAIGVGES
jgi:ABC-type xylose transport system permease subunit